MTHLHCLKITALVTRGYPAADKAGNGSAKPRPALKSSGESFIAVSCFRRARQIGDGLMRQAPEIGRWTYAVPAMMTVCALMFSWQQSARSQEKDAHEITALGVISEHVREIYAREVEVCYNEAGKVARGPQFLACIQRQVRSQQDALEDVYRARMSYLGSYSSELAALLQNAQEAWLHFRDANCGFVRSTSRANYGDEAFQNCVLRTTIYRRVHLHWLIGD
jgi:uncharacterized protein YecT (DUF1311 family)